MSNLKDRNERKCRLCLVDSDAEKMQDLFSKSEFPDSQDMVDDSIPQGDDFSKLPLFAKVEYCCGVKLLPKPQMPTKICIKCINIINMWSNFRQMCCNSQAFLASQIHVVSEEDVVASNIKNLQKMRSELLKKTTEKQQEQQQEKLQPIGKSEQLVSINSTDSHIEIDYIVEEADDVVDDDHRDEDYVYTEYDNEACSDNDTDTNDSNTDIKSFDLTKLQESDFAEILSADDFAEAFDYLNADNDEELERIIDHCANKNVALQTLRRKAVASNMREKSAALKNNSKRKPKEKVDAAAKKLMKPSMFMCNICGNVYSKKPLFQYHMRMHSDVKPYQCEICSKSYRIMSDLRNHMYRHTGERPFKCKFCDRHFMDRSSRHRHERVHTNSRPYTCSVCNKSFTYSAILKNHMKLHTGEKDYICAVCNKSFTLAHQLKAHMLTLTHRQKEAAFEAEGYKVIFEAVEMTKAAKN
uniref:Protein krueppel n=1 Tax=Stomoxys calcitrans TaxID=35570 RepID=A0A1I8NPW9_STOCA